MEISFDKKYKTRDGREVMIYHIFPENTNEPYRVHGAVKSVGGDSWTPQVWMGCGSYTVISTIKHELDLIEVGPYDHIKIDDKVLVWSKFSSNKIPRYFAGVDADGCPKAFKNGATSWSGTSAQTWDYCEKVIEE